MVDGQLIQGKQTVGSVQTISDDIEICSWVVPENTTARVEVHCIVQQATDYTAKSSYKIIATIRRDAGNVSIISGPTVINVEESSIAMTATLFASGSSLTVLTDTADGESHRVTCFMDIYSVEQELIPV